MENNFCEFTEKEVAALLLELHSYLRSLLFAQHCFVRDKYPPYAYRDTEHIFARLISVWFKNSC